MQYSYRQEPNRLVLRLEGMELFDRLLIDQGQHLHVDLGRQRVWIPPPLEWVAQEGTYRPVRVLYDPLAGRVWSPVQWTDTGIAAELASPLPPIPPSWPKADA